MTWTPAECTLPWAERPPRVAEFGELFTKALRALARPEATLLRLTLDGSDRVAAATRDLIARETECCSLFDFSLTPTPDGMLHLEVRVPAGRTEVLDGLAALAAVATKTQAAATRTPGGQGTAVPADGPGDDAADGTRAGVGSADGPGGDAAAGTAAVGVAWTGRRADTGIG